MDYSWPQYDPTLEALLHPERRHPYGLYHAGDDWPVEAICAEFARLAYMPFGGNGAGPLTQALANAGFGSPTCFEARVPLYGSLWRRALQWFRNRDAQAFGATSLDGSVTILAFRGTQPNSFRDLFSDLDFRPVEWSGPGKVHHGFLKAYQSLAGPIAEWLQREGPRRLVVTGHSLGAAMAAVMVAADEDSAAELVTFGSPLAGDAEFAAALGRRPRVLRYVDCSDVVTTVPFTWLGYAHGGEMRYVDRHGTVHDTISEAEIEADRREAAHLYARHHLRIGNAPARNAADHAPVNYVSAVSGKRHDP